MTWNMSDMIYYTMNASTESCCDLVTGLITIPIYGFFTASEFIRFSCQLRFYALRLAPASSGVSFTMMAALSFERFMSIVYPTKHRSSLTQKVFIRYLLANIALHAATTVFSQFFPNVFFMIYGSFRLLFFATIGYFYAKIYLTIRERSGRNKSKVGVVITVQQAQNNNQITRDMMIKQKLAKSCFLICVAYFLCYLPVFLMFFLTIRLEKKDLPALRQYQSWGFALASINPCLNSVVFFWTRPVLQREIKSLVKRIFSCTQSTWVKNKHKHKHSKHMKNGCLCYVSHLRIRLKHLAILFLVSIRLSLTNFYN